jgi:hypothetical protein
MSRGNHATIEDSDCEVYEMAKSTMGADGELPNMVQRIWGSPLIDLLRVQFSGGFAEATIATEPVLVGNRVVPNRIHVEFPSVDLQPSLQLELEVIDGIPQCRSLTITSVENGREVRALDLNAVKLDAWVADSFAAFAFELRGDAFERASTKSAPEEADGVAKVSQAGVAQDIAAAIDFQRARRGKGARRKTPELIQKAADIYRDNYKKGGAKAVAAAFGVSERTAQDYLKQARDAGYLSHVKRGQKGI